MTPTPLSTSVGLNNSNRGYGSVSGENYMQEEEEGKFQSFSSDCNNPNDGYDMEQMRLIVSSLRQQHQQESLKPENSSVETIVPSFYPDAYYYKESRQRWRRMTMGIFGGLLVGLLLAKGWSLLYNAQAATPALDSPLELDGEFDYIVVGGGPSGILAATQLAQKLPTAKIVLMESGTASQSSVLVSLSQEGAQQSTTIDASGRLHAALNPAPALNKYDIPLMWSGIATTQQRSHDFQVQPDPRSSTYWPIPLALLARGLGGCGLHNAMIYIRSLPSCFQRWNMTKWTFDQMLPVYKSLETFVSNPRHDNATAASVMDQKERLEHRGHNGPIFTATASHVDAVGDYFVKAATASGLPLAGGQESSGFNHIDAEDRIGAGFYEFNVKSGVRHSVVNAMLGGRNGEIPNNLLVLTGRTVTQILWSKQDASGGSKPKAIGVTYINDKSGKYGKILLSRTPSTEVILAAGAIMTPQLLWNSGIGDGAALLHLPGVGKNLQDHPVLGMAYEITKEMAEDAPQLYAVADEMEDYMLAVQVLNDMEQVQRGKPSKGFQSSGQHEESISRKRQWALDKLGSFGTPGFSAGAFLRSPWAEKRNDAPPDIQLTVFPRVTEPHQPKSKNQIDLKFMRNRAMLVTVALLEPEARYEVRPSNMTSTHYKTAPFSTANSDGDQIASDFANALQYPLPSIRLPPGENEYLSDKDVKRLAWGMEQVRHIMKFPPMANITTTELYPGTSVVDDGITLDQYIRANHLANSHWVGTTKMGRDDDPWAVLDESLRVRGVEGLRVFDSGAIPAVPNGNTHSTVCAVASRGVELILEERESSYYSRG